MSDLRCVGRLWSFSNFWFRRSISRNAWLNIFWVASKSTLISRWAFAKRPSNNFSLSIFSLRETCSFKMARIAGKSAEEIFPDEINLESSSFASSREWDVFGVVVAVFGASACDMLWEVGKLAKDPVVGGDAQPGVVEQCKIESLDTCDRRNR